MTGYVPDTGTDVVITGLGVVSPLGHELQRFWAGLAEGRVPVRPLDYPGSAIDGCLTYVVSDPPPVAADHAGRASRFAVAAGAAALADAGLSSVDSEAVGVCVGAGNGDSDLLEADRDGRRSVRGLEWYPYNAAGTLGAELGLLGPNLTVSTACAAGAYAVAMAADMIRDGEADVVLAGGAEAVSRPAMGAFLRLGAVDPLHCRPFDTGRQGTVYGEGAAFLVLESAAHAAARGRTPYASVLGAGWSCDAFHVTAPDPRAVQAVRAAQDALARSGTDVSAVGAVICHGTGTAANDAMESRALSELLGERTMSVPATAIKASLGHSGGASGAFSCLTAALVVAHGQVPPVATLEQQDGQNPQLQLVTGAPSSTAGPAVLVNAYAFGGNNVSVLLGPVPA